MLFLISLSIATTFASAASASCSPVPLYQAGRAVTTICAESVPGDTVVLDLGDDWAPRLFSQTPEHPQGYRDTFVALANERPGTTREWDTARRDRHHELFGIFPSFTVVRGRLEDDVRHACHAHVDDESAAAIHEHLRCEGLLPAPVRSAKAVPLNRQALAVYQRRHMIPARGGQLDEETRTALAGDSRELDFRTLLRALRERAVDATGLIEDGSAANAWEPVLGRHLDAREYRTLLRADPLLRGAPDLVARVTEAAAVALGWTSADAARRSLRQGVPSRVAIRTQPPLPAYHGPDMQLRAEIDRGDVWSEQPVDESGRRRPSPVRRRPTLVLYAVTGEGEIPLVRWPTTIGGWQSEKQADGSVAMEYKPSPVGRRYWRDLLAAPAWFPPPSTPDDELVRRRPDGTWTTDDDAVGPGYRSAYGLMALLHHRAETALEGGPPRFRDIQIRSHGSGNYRSILRGSSHGCHRLFNHLAIRLGSFLLRHHDHLRHGAMEEAYARRIVWKDRSLVLRAGTRGYRYELVPPIAVDVLPGRTVRSRRPKAVSPAPAISKGAFFMPGAVSASASPLLPWMGGRSTTMTLRPSTENQTVPPTGCCPPFDPATWQDKEVTWRDKPFVRDHVTCLFHVPLNMGRKVTEDMARIQSAHMEPERPLMLSDDKSPWGADIFIEVKGAVPGATMDRLSGTFLTKVFEGPFRDAGKWAQQMAWHVASRGRTLEKLYFGYTTCPSCAKAYGKNYVVLFARVKEPDMASGPTA